MESKEDFCKKVAHFIWEFYGKQEGKAIEDWTIAELIYNETTFKNSSEVIEKINKMSEKNPDSLRTIILISFVLNHSKQYDFAVRLGLRHWQ